MLALSAVLSSSWGGGFQDPCVLWPPACKTGSQSHSHAQGGIRRPPQKSTGSCNSLWFASSVSHQLQVLTSPDLFIPLPPLLLWSLGWSFDPQPPPGPTHQASSSLPRALTPGGDAWSQLKESVEGPLVARTLPKGWAFWRILLGNSNEKPPPVKWDGESLQNKVGLCTLALEI